ncbi:PASTA domain-containing protein [Streptomyces syringium]|uniref:PASTA domain-containing protein n=1 Tax=Streptomyces syringium TaxID=76729 RepID=UPI0033B1341B
MRTRSVLTFLAAAALLTLTACESSDTAAKPAQTKDGRGKGGSDTAALPDLVGKGLQSAQDQAQAAGFRRLASHDALGRGRTQAFDRNWKVCSQTPAPGTRPTDTKVDFGAVKLTEDCPAKDGSEERAPAKAKGTMPPFTGKSVKIAREALDSSTSLTVKDASGSGRTVLVESNWQVCAQDPKAGTKLDGQPVRLDAVKFGEGCP